MITCNCGCVVRLCFCLARSPGCEGELTVSVSVPLCARAVAAGAGPEVQQRQGEEELHCHAGLPAEHHQRLLAHGVPGELKGDRDDHQRGGEREGEFPLPGENGPVWIQCWMVILCCCIPSVSVCCCCCCMDEPLGQVALEKEILISRSIFLNKRDWLINWFSDQWLLLALISIKQRCLFQ